MYSWTETQIASQVEKIISASDLGMLFSLKVLGCMEVVSQNDLCQRVRKRANSKSCHRLWLSAPLSCHNEESAWAAHTKQSRVWPLVHNRPIRWSSQSATTCNPPPTHTEALVVPRHPRYRGPDALTDRNLMKTALPQRSWFACQCLPSYLERLPSRRYNMVVGSDSQVGNSGSVAWPTVDLVYPRNQGCLKKSASDTIGVLPAGCVGALMSGDGKESSQWRKYWGGASPTTKPSL